MASAEVIVHRYAQALHALAGEAGLREQVEVQLVALHEVLSANPDVPRQLANPRVGRSAKEAVLTALLGPAVCDVLRSTVLLMNAKGRSGLLTLLRGAYEGIAMAAEGRVVARVVSAAPLDAATRSALASQLAAATGQRVTLDESVDASLLGGLAVTIGSRRIDGSLKRRLDLLQQRMLAAPLGAGG